jgi:hypothetical protein
MLKKMITGVALVAVVGLVATAAYVLGSGEPAADVPVVASAPGTGDGIQVHGSWTIEVSDPDGTSASVHEFENALDSSGASHLYSVLARGQSIGRWAVALTNSGAAAGGISPCINTSGNSFPCDLHEVVPGNVDATDPNVFSGLVLQNSPSGFSLSGAVTAVRDGAIDRVFTKWSRCSGGSVTPDDCADQASPLFTTFTLKTLASADVINVLAGQSVNVTVVITFQ